MKRMLLVLSIALFTFSPVFAEEGRLIVAVRDVTESFLYLKESNGLVVTQIIPRLNFNDSMVFIRLGSNAELTYHYDFPAYIRDTTYSNFIDYKRKKFVLEKAKQEVEKSRGQLLSWFKEEMSRAPQKGGTTRVHQSLEILTSLFKTSEKREKFLFIFSDLLHEDGKLKTNLPPKQLIPFNGVHVICVFTQWKSYSEFEGLQKAWGGFFSSATSFRMYDPASSMLVKDILPTIIYDLPKFQMTSY